MEYIDEKIEKFVKKICQEKEDQKEKFRIDIERLQEEKFAMIQELEDLRISNQKFKITTLNMRNLIEKYSLLKRKVEQLQGQLRQTRESKKES